MIGSNKIFSTTTRHHRSLLNPRIFPHHRPYGRIIFFFVIIFLLFLLSLDYSVKCNIRMGGEMVVVFDSLAGE